MCRATSSRRSRRAISRSPTAPRPSFSSPACRLGSSITGASSPMGSRRSRAPCFKKAAKLYGLHLLLTFCALAIFGAAYWFAGGADALIAPHGRAVVFQEPLRGGLGVALLSHQLGYFNILPLYVVLMALDAADPGASAVQRGGGVGGLARRLCVGQIDRVRSAELARAGRLVLQSVRLAARLHARRAGGGSLARSAAEASPIAQALSLLLAAAGTLIVTDGLSFAPGLRDAAFAALDIGKQNLGLARLGEFSRHRLSPGHDKVFRRAWRARRRAGGAAARSPLPASLRRQFAAQCARPGGRGDARRRARRALGARPRIRLHPRLHRGPVRAGELVGMEHFASWRRARRCAYGVAAFAAVSLGAIDVRAAAPIVCPAATPSAFAENGAANAAR